MAEYTALAPLFTDIANAIRSKTGETGAITANSFPNKITSIQTTSFKIESMDGHIIIDNAYRYFKHNELKNSNSKLFIFYGRLNKGSTDNVGILGLKTSNLLDEIWYTSYQYIQISTSEKHMTYSQEDGSIKIGRKITYFLPDTNAFIILLYI